MCYGFRKSSESGTFPILYFWVWFPWNIFFWHMDLISYLVTCLYFPIFHEKNCSLVIEFSICQLWLCNISALYFSNLGILFCSFFFLILWLDNIKRPVFTFTYSFFCLIKSANKALYWCFSLVVILFSSLILFGTF